MNTVISTSIIENGLKAKKKIFRDFKISQDNISENVKKAIGLMSKTTLHVQHAFLLISLSSLHDYDVQSFIEDIKKLQQNFISLSEIGYGSWAFNTRRVRLHFTK